MSQHNSPTPTPAEELSKILPRSFAVLLDTFDDDDYERAWKRIESLFQELMRDRLTGEEWKVLSDAIGYGWPSGCDAAYHLPGENSTYRPSHLRDTEMTSPSPEKADIERLVDEAVKQFAWDCGLEFFPLELPNFRIARSALTARYEELEKENAELKELLPTAEEATEILACSSAWSG